MARLRTHNRRARRMTWEEFVYAPFRAWGPSPRQLARRRKHWKALVEAARWGLLPKPLSDKTVARIKAGVTRHTLPEGTLRINGQDYPVSDIEIRFESPSCPNHSKPLKG